MGEGNANREAKTRVAHLWHPVALFEPNAIQKQAPYFSRGWFPIFSGLKETRQENNHSGGGKSWDNHTSDI